MNRKFHQFFIILLLGSPAFCQEADSLVVEGVADSLVVEGVADSLAVTAWADSLAAAGVTDSLIVPGGADPEFLPGELRPIRRAGKKDIPAAAAVAEPDLSHSSKKAIMYALVLPGLGQGYNRKFFKIPIVYAALGGVGYAIVYNTNQYRESTANYIALQDEVNKWYLDTWRRNLELSYIGLIVVFALQVLDAYVDAELYNWDVTDNLALRVAPSLQPMLAPVGKTGQVYGLTCSFDLKRR